MKRFSFRLESILRLREYELEGARVELAAVESERLEREAEMRTESDRLSRGRDLLEAEIQNGADGERLALRADAVASGRFRLARVERARADLEAPLQAARARVHLARTRVRSLERLREDAELEHRKVGLAAEQAELEELAVERLAARGPGGASPMTRRENVG
jgi:flagellar export protein FliJ